MIILKFGGTSVKDATRIKSVANILIDARKKDPLIGAVVSAFGGVTDELINISRQASLGNNTYMDSFSTLRKRHYDTVAELELKDDTDLKSFLETSFQSIQDILHGVSLVKELSPRTTDFISGHGEILSAKIISSYLKKLMLPGDFTDARLLIRTDDNFGNARVDFEETNSNIRSYFEKATGIYVITGFIASAPGKEMTTLGRGGSDYTASIFGAAMNATAIEIWTDVDGVMTADPRKVNKSFSIKSMTYEEAMEMSHFGAKVIHPPTILPALSKKIPLIIKNTFHPDHPGTFISTEPADPQFLIKGISSIDNISLLTLQGSGMVGVAGISAKLFSSLSSAKVNVILITQGSSEHTISFAVRPEDARIAQKAIEDAFQLEIRANLIEKVRIENDLSIVAVIGENMRNTPGVSGRLFQSLGKNGISVVATAQGSSELNISIVVHRVDLDKALNSLHQAFFLSDVKTLSVFLVGTGLIGKTLLRQIQKHRKHLRSARSMEIILAGVANSKKMFFDKEGISLAAVEELLKNATEEMHLETFISKMKGMNLSQTVFVDCTSEQHVASAYREILAKNISIVTPNKVANTGPVEEYRALREEARRNNVRFMYETNVGAGLPVINTLNDLISSGDEIVKIEAVLSGTLSFIFNNFNSSKRFSEVVKQAKELGYTEPDPRIDLSGKDVARKLLILAREAGHQLELADIEIASILPDECMTASSIPCFFDTLEKNNEYFAAIARRAEEKNKVLRFIAKLEKGKASISLEEVDSSHPFFNLSGSDNIISFTTERYADRPLVVKGPGAGAEVTAAGVFAELITIGKYFE